MDIARKLEIAKTAVDSISSHRDTDAAVRKGALDAIMAYCDEQAAEIDADVQTQIDKATGKAAAEVTSEDL